MDKMISYTTIHRSHTLRKTFNCEGNKWHKVYGGCKNEISNKHELNWVVDVLSISPSKEMNTLLPNWNWLSHSQFFTKIMLPTKFGQTHN